MVGQNSGVIRSLIERNWIPEPDIPRDFDIDKRFKAFEEVSEVSELVEVLADIKWEMVEEMSLELRLNFESLMKHGP